MALVYSRSFFDRMGGRYPALVLVFLAGTIDFALSGDLFNMFVGFELVAITAVVLTGFYAEAEGPLEFAVTASVGTLLFLVGIALLYDRTQTLDLAGMGEALSGHRLGGAAIVAFAALATALLTKAAIVPFHFWLPDAYGTAPVPACVLFAGVMSEMGVFGLARIWTTVFSGARMPGGTAGLSAGLCALGALTALVGAVMAGRQRRLRRLLGFVTVSHTGLYLLGLGLLTSGATAAVAVLVVGDGLAKAAMFLAAGVVALHRSPGGSAGGVPGSRAGGPARPCAAGSGHLEAARPLGSAGAATLAILAVGALALADLPPFASAEGKNLLVVAAGRWGAPIEAVYALSVIGSSGAVLAAVGRRLQEALAARRVASGGLAVGGPAAGGAEAVGGGEDDETTSTEEQAAGSGPAGAGRLLAPAVLLLAASLAVGVFPHLDRSAIRAATGMFDRRAYDAVVLRGHRLALPSPSPSRVPGGAALLDCAEALGAVVLGALLASRRGVGVVVRSAAASVTGWLQRLHCGPVGDQVTWQMLGTVALTAIAGVALR